MIAYQFGNDSDTIKDMDVFKIPSYCMAPTPAPHSRVCAPEQYEAMAFGKLAQVAGGKPMAFDIHVMTSRDFKNKMEATSTDLMSDGKVVYHGRSIVDWGKVCIILSGKVYIRLDWRKVFYISQ